MENKKQMYDLKLHTLWSPLKKDGFIGIVGYFDIVKEENTTEQQGQKKENGKQSQRGIRNEKEKMEQGFGCTFNDGDEYITSVGLRRKK